MSWRHWLHPNARRGPNSTRPCRLPTPHGHNEIQRGHVWLHADCGRAKFDAQNQLIAVACPAVFCGSVWVTGDRITAHLAWDGQPCRWSGWRILDDSIPSARAVP